MYMPPVYLPDTQSAIHIWRGRYCLFLWEGLARTSKTRIGKDKVPRFAFFYLGAVRYSSPKTKSSIPMSTTHNEMRNEILSVITNKIPQGVCFDAHAVIEFIEKNNNPLYIDFCNGREGSDGYGDAHGRMSRILTQISEEPNSPIKIVGKSWSANINGNFDNTELKCFKKL